MCFLVYILYYCLQKKSSMSDLNTYGVNFLYISLDLWSNYWSNVLMIEMKQEWERLLKSMVWSEVKNNFSVFWCSKRYSMCVIKQDIATVMFKWKGCWRVWWRSWSSFRSCPRNVFEIFLRKAIFKQKDNVFLLVRRWPYSAELSPVKEQSISREWRFIGCYQVGEDFSQTKSSRSVARLKFLPQLLTNIQGKLGVVELPIWRLHLWVQGKALGQLCLGTIV